MEDQPSRRAFLQSLGVAVIGAHLAHDVPMAAREPAGHRIAECDLITSASIAAMETFYRDRLELRT